MLPWILLALALLVAVALFAVGWAVSDRFLVPQPYTLRPEFEIVAVEVLGGGDEEHPGSGELEVVLPVADEYSQFGEVRREGVYNLLWEGGYGRLGPVLADDGARVVRRLSGVMGRAPQAGERARFDSTVYRRDPLRDHGIEFEELELSGDAGRLFAWWIDGGREGAVLALHGRRRADRRETLRILPSLVESGWSVLALAYRNHDRSAPSPDGLYHYGAGEADDALLALAELARRGVDRVLLYGFSMGGAVGLEAAKRWPEQGPRLVGIVLDSPLLDPRTVIRHGVRSAGAPAPERVADLALTVARLRTGVDWRRLDQRREAEAIEVPLLLIAGTGDSTIPVELMDEFVRRVTAPVDYLRLDGVEHVEGWNSDPELYERTVRGFLDERAAGRPRSR